MKRRAQVIEEPRIWIACTRFDGVAPAALSPSVQRAFVFFVDFVFFVQAAAPAVATSQRDSVHVD